MNLFAGVVLRVEKHRIPRSPLLTMHQYLQELQTMMSSLSELIAASMDGVAAGSDAEADLRAYRINQLETFQRCYDTYASVNPEKVVADWEVYSNLLDPIEVRICAAGYKCIVWFVVFCLVYSMLTCVNST